MTLCTSTPGPKNWPCRLPIEILETAISNCGHTLRGGQVGGWGAWVVEQESGKGAEIFVGRVERV